jgi:hypothetical protein
VLSVLSEAADEAVATLKPLPKRARRQPTTNGVLGNYKRVLLYFFNRFRHPVPPAVTV